MIVHELSNSHEFAFEILNCKLEIDSNMYVTDGESVETYDLEKYILYLSKSCVKLDGVVSYYFTYIDDEFLYQIPVSPDSNKDKTITNMLSYGVTLENIFRHLDL